MHGLTILNFRCVFEWEIAYTVRTLYESLADYVRVQSTKINIIYYTLYCLPIDISKDTYKIVCTIANEKSMLLWSEKMEK